jgi:conjugative transfer pilus assembly protein TraH
MKVPARCMTRFLAAFIAASLVVQAPLVHADTLGAQAQQLFNDLGGMSNVTRPQAFKGQTMNTYTGGNLFVRAPQKNYQLLSAQLPSISAGCGGINLFGGSFSHISGDALKSMMKSITAAIPGVVFDLALKSVQPLLGETMEVFKGWEQFVNRANINSCEASKWLVGKVGDQMGMSTQSACQSVGSQWMDAEEARDKCNKGNGTDATLKDARANKEIPPFTGNLVWEGLKKFQQLDFDDRELIMSITGTTTYFPQSTDNAVQPVSTPPTITSIRDLLYGAGNGSVTGDVQVMVLQCGDRNQCLYPTSVSVNFKSLIERVDEMMRSLDGKIKNNQAPSTAEISFINSVPVPVYQLLSVANATKNDGVPSAKIAQYKEWIAVEFAHSLLTRLAQVGLATGQVNKFKLAAPQIDDLKEHKANADRLLRVLDGERAEASKKAAVMVQIAGDIEGMRRTMRAAMPQQVQDLMDYSSTQ